MRADALLAVMFGIAVPAFVQAAIMQGPVVNPANNHTYYLLTANTWSASQAEAVALGGNLATVRSQAENDWIFNHFFRSQGNGWAGWIGLFRASVGGPFQWASGESITYTNWAPNEPNFPDERFVYQLPTLNGNLVSGRWNNDYDRITSTYSPLSGPSIPLFEIHGVVEAIPESTSAIALALTAALVARRARGSN